MQEPKDATWSILRHRLPAHLLLLSTLVLSGCGSMRGGEACFLSPVREVDIPLKFVANGESGFAYTESISIESVPAKLALDTGSQSSTLTPDFYQKIKSKLITTQKNVELASPGGFTSNSNFYRGDLVFSNGQTSYGLDYAVSKLPTGNYFDGWLGNQIFLGESNFDKSYDIDMPHSIAKIFLKCKSAPDSVMEKYLPTGGNNTLMQSVTNGGLLYLPISIDNIKTLGLVDTGGVTSMISNQLAHKLGITDSDLSHDPQIQEGVIGGDSFNVAVQNFNNVMIGSVPITGNFSFWVLEDTKFAPNFDFDIGNDILRYFSIFKKQKSNDVILNWDNQ